MRQSLPRVLLLLQVEFVEVVVQLVEDHFGLKNLDAKCQCELTSGHLLLWRCRCLGISPRLAKRPKSSGQHVVSCLHLQKFRILVSS